MTRENQNSIFYAAGQALRRHATGGNVLILATFLALLAANIPGVSTLYGDFWNQEVRLQVGTFNIFSHAGHSMTLLQFINDALMAVFFFSIGLEIKREILVGELASVRQALLPITGAIGGMAIPVLIFFLLAHNTNYIDGAAIPMATDIAFTLGILAMLGKRVPVSLKIFLTTLAVVDDIGGIIVIAIFYSSHIELPCLLWAAGILVILLLGAHLRIQSKIFYLTLGGVVWFLFLNSGIHPTIAGVLVAFCVPARPVFQPRRYIEAIHHAMSHFDCKGDIECEERMILSHEQMNWLKEVEHASDKVISPLQELEDSLHPIVNFLIVPLFAFANAGIMFVDINPASVVEGLSLAIICALVIGKFIGILGFSWVTVKLGLAPMPTRTNWTMMSAISLLAGIGFTVSLFIANLSFGNEDAESLILLNQAKLGIVVASVLAGVGGYCLLRMWLPRNNADRKTDTATDIMST